LPHCLKRVNRSRIFQTNNLPRHQPRTEIALRHEILFAGQRDDRGMIRQIDRIGDDGRGRIGLRPPFLAAPCGVGNAERETPRP